MLANRGPQPAHQTPPQSLNVQRGKLKDYPTHQRFQLKGMNAVICYIGQFYDGATGVRLKHDIDWLKKNRYTVMKEMAPFILKKVEQSHKTCAGCNYSRLPSNASFCSACGAQQGKLSMVNAADDRLAQMLKMVDPENPFGILNEMDLIDNPRPQSRAKPSDFLTKEDIADDIAESMGALSFVAGVPGEKAVAASPKFNINPFATVDFSTKVGA